MERLPPETVAAVRPALPALVERIVEGVGAGSEIYGTVLTAPEGIGIRLGIEQAAKAFLDAIERGGPPARDTAELWRRIGEAEFQAGRPLDGLRAAFRTGTRAAWHAAAEIASDAGLPAPTVIALAEQIFIYTDDLAAEVVEGYLRMQSDEAGERERRRRRLTALLLDPEGHDAEAVEHAAELARWRLPKRLAVVALTGDSPPRGLDPDVLAGADPEGAFLLVPDPEGPGRAGALRRSLDGQAAAIGPTVAARDAHQSLRWARMALALGDGGVINAHDHLPDLILLAERELAQALAADRLRPLLELPEPERQRLLETLRAWLDHQRHTPGVAAELHVHPQTVRYRIAKLRELLGAALETPDGRFELQMALRVPRA
jgi:PucR-like helix-turn-helix protein